MQQLIDQLKSQMVGEVKDDPITRRIYSVDASIYEVEPLCVAIPKTKEELIDVVKTAARFGVPLIPRGAATGITGGCLGNGIVIDLSKYLNRILSIDWENRRVVCEPGVVQDALNDVLATKGFRLGPDTSTGNRATLGGMLANNSAGSRSLKYGKMVDSILEVEVVLSNGELIYLKEVDDVEFQKKCTLQGREGEIYREVDRIRKNDSEEIEKRFPKIPRRVSGYNLDELIKPGNVNLSKLFAGSEGSLGIATEIVLEIVPVHRCSGLLIVHLNNMVDGLKVIDQLLSFHPLSIEMIDHHIIEMGKLSPVVKGELEWLDGNPDAIFAIEIEGPTETEVETTLKVIEEELKNQNIGYSYRRLLHPAEMDKVWALRKAGLGLLLSKRSEEKAIAFIEDISVSPQKLAPFMTEFKHYLKSKGKEAGIYGHVGSGCIHIRPYINLRDKEEIVLMETIMKDVTQMLLNHEGALSGEHGDGLIRSWLNRTLFGETIFRAFEELKRAFDPENRMNPGKIVNPNPFHKDFRIDPETPQQSISTFLDFSKEGGLPFAAGMCNGNGQCRKREGTMCPSFQASLDEFHTTRARAQTLRAIFTGRLPIEEFTGKGLKEVLDLCIECKGCKKECPSQVDMAKMKAEFLYHYNKKHGIAFRDRLFAFIGTINKCASPFAKLFNALSQTTFTKFFLNLIGITTKRPLPMLASTRFSTWFKNRPIKTGLKKVVLFNDTFTEFHCPEVGIAAVEVLEAFGYSVILPEWQCCGRTMISRGFLLEAKTAAAHLVKTLEPFAKENTPIVGLEPSCLSAILDDYHGLLGYCDSTLKTVVPHCYLFDAFIASHIRNNELPIPFSCSQPIRVHCHCHQKSLNGSSDTLRILNAIPGANYQEIPTGCCGMAGSFGYEKEHYLFSKQIAELKLVPGLKSLSDETVVISNGFSCRHQIAHFTQFKPLHLAEFLVKYQTESLVPKGERKSN